MPEGESREEVRTHEVWEGGQTIEAEAPLERIPVFAKRQRGGMDQKEE